jgi:hypothetical protein
MIFSERRVPPIGSKPEGMLFRIMLGRMIRKKPAPDSVRAETGLPEKIMPDQKVRAPIGSI